MKTRPFVGMMLAVSSLELACGGEPTPDCVIGRGSWIAKYTLVAGQSVTGACVTDFASPYSAAAVNPFTGGKGRRKGEVLGVNKYGFNVPHPTLGIYTSTFADVAPNGIPTALYAPSVAVGTFQAAQPDNGNICTATNFSLGSIDGTPTGTVRYQWNTVQWYVTTQYNGTQLSGIMAYTNGGCTANYTVFALYPEVACDMDSDCAAIAAPGQLFGSGINPDYQVFCDTSLPDPDESYCDPGVSMCGNGPNPGRAGTCFLRDISRFPSIP